MTSNPYVSDIRGKLSAFKSNDQCVGLINILLFSIALSATTIIAGLDTMVVVR